MAHLEGTQEASIEEQLKIIKRHEEIVKDLEKEEAVLIEDLMLSK